MVTELRGIFNGNLTREEIDAAKQYRLGRYQRGAQTVAGIAGSYAGRYFFDGVIDDYYRIPERIKAVTKDNIIAIANSMFTQNIWGFGVLGNCGKDFTLQLQDQIAPLWKGQFIPTTQLKGALSHGRAI